MGLGLPLGAFGTLNAFLISEILSGEWEFDEVVKSVLGMPALFQRGWAHVLRLLLPSFLLMHTL